MGTCLNEGTKKSLEGVGGGGEDVESRMDGAMYYYVSHPLVFLLSTIAREDDKIKF